MTATKYDVAFYAGFVAAVCGNNMIGSFGGLLMMAWAYYLGAKYSNVLSTRP